MYRYFSETKKVSPIYSFNQYLQSTYYVPATILGHRDTHSKRKTNNPCLHRIRVRVCEVEGRQKWDETESKQEKSVQYINSVNC